MYQNVTQNKSVTVWDCFIPPLPELCCLSHSVAALQHHSTSSSPVQSFPLAFDNKWPVFLAFSTQSWFHKLLCTFPKFEKTRSNPAELDGKGSNFNATLISSGDTLHFELRMHVHHMNGERWSAHEADIRQGWKGSAPAVNAHKSAIYSFWIFWM